MPTIQFTNALTGEIQKTIEMGDKTSGEIIDELLPVMLKKGAVIDWKKLFYEKCEVIVSLQVENEKLKKEIMDKQITHEFYTDFLDPGGAGEPVQKEDIDQFCEDFEYDDEKKQMLYSEFNCYDSDEE